MTGKIEICFTPCALGIRRSLIDRLGVFAEKGIPRGRKVIEYTGERITRRQAARRFRKIRRSKGPKRYYLAFLNRRWIVDGAVGGSGQSSLTTVAIPIFRCVDAVVAFCFIAAGEFVREKS